MELEQLLATAHDELLAAAELEAAELAAAQDKLTHLQVCGLYSEVALGLQGQLALPCCSPPSLRCSVAAADSIHPSPAQPLLQERYHVLEQQAAAAVAAVAEREAQVRAHMKRRAWLGGIWGVAGATCGETLSGAWVGAMVGWLPPPGCWQARAPCWGCTASHLLCR